jgi:hypothetical protein
MRLTRTATLITAGLLTIGALTACGGDDDYQGICIDPATQQRVNDEYCTTDRHDGHHYGWGYYPVGSRVPAVGHKAAGYKTTVPSGRSYVRGGAPKTGGPVAKPSVKQPAYRNGTGGGAGSKPAQKSGGKSSFRSGRR